jgi:hypothetical protein
LIPHRDGVAVATDGDPGAQGMAALSVSSRAAAPHPVPAVRRCFSSIAESRIEKHHDAPDATQVPP